MMRKSASVLIQLCLALSLISASPKSNGGRELIKAEDLKEWLTYLASDDLDGRATFTEGLGLAAGYISAQLKSLGVKPGGPNGSYFQKVAVLGVKSTNRSTLTVEAGGQTRTFKNTEGIAFPANVGSKRTFSSDQIEFLGYGLNVPQAGFDDYKGHDVKGKTVVILGIAPAKGLQGPQYLRTMIGRSRSAIEERGAIAAIGPGLGFRGQGGQPSEPAQAPNPQAQAPTQPQQGQGRGQGQGQGQGGRFGGPVPDGDFTTVQRLDNPVAPALNGQDEFFEFLFSSADVKYSELKAKASAGEPLPSFTLKNVRLTFNIDADYEVVRTQFTRNVVGIVDGTDPRLKDTFVAFGAHYDHVGYAEGEVAQGPNGPRRIGARGRVTDGQVQDRIWNGADDDGSGSATLLGIAKAYATGPKPKRSVIFVWHAGEERGLWGSRYFADYPSIPIDKIVAQVNMDMVGRNRDNKDDEANSVYLVGSDRISTEFHNITIDANAALSKPLRLDFEMNDPADLEQVYYRSDHYSYAAKGIPIVFLTTGLHPDYHANTDSVEKIGFEKMARIGQLAYEIGMRAAMMDHQPARDNKGPRVGKGSSGKLAMQ